jgi:hypothetical protein
VAADVTPEQQAELAALMQALSLAIPAYERLTATDDVLLTDIAKHLRWTIKGICKKSFHIVNN